MLQAFFSYSFLFHIFYILFLFLCGISRDAPENCTQIAIASKKHLMCLILVPLHNLISSRSVSLFFALTLDCFYLFIFILFILEGLRWMICKEVFFLSENCMHSQMHFCCHFLFYLFLNKNGASLKFHSRKHWTTTTLCFLCYLLS